MTLLVLIALLALVVAGCGGGPKVTETSRPTARSTSRAA
jgi:hypothetical protein